MNTFTVDQLSAEPDRFAAVVARDGTARLRTSTGDEYVVRPADERPRGLARITGVTLSRPLRSGELVELIHEMHAYEPEWMKEIYERMAEAKRRNEVVDAETIARSPADATGGPLPT